MLRQEDTESVPSLDYIAKPYFKIQKKKKRNVVNDICKS